MTVSPKLQWTLLFLGTTGVALGEELYAAFDSSENTTPWTGFIAAQPGWLIALETAVFFVWWPIHIYLAHKRQAQRLEESYQRGYQCAAGHAVKLINAAKQPNANDGSDAAG